MRINCRNGLVEMLWQTLVFFLKFICSIQIILPELYSHLFPHILRKLHSLSVLEIIHSDMVTIILRKEAFYSRAVSILNLSHLDDSFVANCKEQKHV